MRVLMAVVLLLSACAPVAGPTATDTPATPVAEPTAGQTSAPTPSPSPIVQGGPVLANPVVTMANVPFPIAPTFTLTRSAVPTDDFTARWGIERYLEGLDRYREFGDYLPARGAFGEAVAAALVESRTPGVKRTFVLESLRVEAVYTKPWGTQALADVRVTIVDRAVDGSAPDQRETGLLRLSGGSKLQVVDSWDVSTGRWFNGRIPDDSSGLRESVAEAIGLYLRKESWAAGGPVETYADGFGMTPFKTARNAYVAAFDRARMASRTFEDVSGTIERHDTFAELPGGITTARLSATVITKDTDGRTQRESVTRRVKVFFGNWMPEVVDEEVTPGVWRSGGDLALVEIDVNLA